MTMTWMRKRSVSKTIAEAADAGLQQRDQRLLGQLLEAGARLGQSRSVSYYLYLPTAEAARAAAAEAIAARFDAHARPPLSEYPDQFPVIAVLHDCHLTVEVIRANSNFFGQLAHRYGGDYDGWQATA